eukprot:3019408-Amphidinium_carterae.1
MQKEVPEYLGRRSVFRIPFREHTLNGKVMLLTVTKRSAGDFGRSGDSGHTDMRLGDRSEHDDGGRSSRKDRKDRTSDRRENRQGGSGETALCGDRRNRTDSTSGQGSRV